MNTLNKHLVTSQLKIYFKHIGIYACSEKCNWNLIISDSFCLFDFPDYIQNSVSTSEIKVVIRTKRNDEDKLFKKWNLSE